MSEMFSCANLRAFPSEALHPGSTVRLPAGRNDNHSTGSEPGGVTQWGPGPTLEARGLEYRCGPAVACAKKQVIFVLGPWPWRELIKLVSQDRRQCVKQKRPVPQFGGCRLPTPQTLFRALLMAILI